MSALIAVASVGCHAGTVVRVIDGEIVPHRFISGRAYEAYARGVRAEATGHYADALTSYVEASDADPRGVEPWTRRGAVACRLKRFDDAQSSFAEASDRDDTFEPLWRERAICDLSRGDVPAALRASERAELLDPDQEEAVLLRASILERAGDPKAAMREVVGLTTRRPSENAWRWQLGAAERTGDEPAARLARRALAARALSKDPTQPAAPPTPEAALALVDDALRAGDVRTAERLGRGTKQSPGVLAARAVAIGRSDLGAKEGERIVMADPTNGDAMIAAIAGRDLARDADGVAKLCDRARGKDLGTHSSLAALLMLDVLARAVGPDAVADAPELQGHRADAVEEALRLAVIAESSSTRAAAPPR